ncbi:MAG: histidine kinase [Vicinamibacterales bacterium]
MRERTNDRRRASPGDTVSAIVRTNAPSTVWIIALVGTTTSLLALAVSAQTYLSMLGHGHSFARILLWQLTCWGLWAIAAPWIMRSGSLLYPFRRIGPRRWSRLVALGLAIIAIRRVVAAEVTVLFQPFIPVETYEFRGVFVNQFASLFAVDLLVYVLLLIGGGVLAAHLRESRLEAELARSQFHALCLEIQPHFLFNTLNSIAASIRSHNNPQALDMLLGLSELMRTTVDRPSQQLARLGGPSLMK